MPTRPVDSAAPGVDRPLLVGSLVVFFGSLLLVLLPWGQVWDDALLLEDRAEPKGLARDLTHGLHWINVSTWLVMGVVITAVGAGRRRGRLGLVAAGAFVVTVLAAELLKYVVPRPDWGADQAADLLAKAMDTWPSGHTASVTAFVLGLLAVASARWCLPVVVAGSMLITGVGVGVVVAGWHRPSDIFGGSALAVVVFLGLRAWTRSTAAGPSGRWVRWLPPALMMATALLVVLMTRGHGAALPLVVTMAVFAGWVAIATTRYGLAR